MRKVMLVVFASIFLFLVGCDIFDREIPTMEVSKASIEVYSEEPNWIELVEAFDNIVDSELEVHVDASDVNMDVTGEYDIVVTVIDERGNEAEEVHQISIVDGISPIILLNGDEEIRFED